MPAVIWLACSKFGGPDPSACDGCSSAAARHSSPAPAASLCFPCHNCLAALRCYSAELFDRRFTANSHEHLEKLFTIESQDVTQALAGARATGWGLRGGVAIAGVCLCSFCCRTKHGHGCGGFKSVPHMLLQQTFPTLGPAAPLQQSALWITCSQCSRSSRDLAVARQSFEAPVPSEGIGDGPMAPRAAALSRPVLHMLLRQLVNAVAPTCSMSSQILSQIRTPLTAPAHAVVFMQPLNALCRLLTASRRWGFPAAVPGSG